MLLTLAGRLADRRFGTHPWLLIVGVVLAMVISSVALIVRASRLFARLDPPPPKSHGNFPRR